MDQAPTPKEITKSGDRDICIIWNNGKESVLQARFLRLKCPCAYCVEEMTGKVQIKPSDVPSDIRPVSISLVGRYAIQVFWSDGHSTGIYPFSMLYDLSN